VTLCRTVWVLALMKPLCTRVVRFGGCGYMTDKLISRRSKRVADAQRMGHRARGSRLAGIGICGYCPGFLCTTVVRTGGCGYTTGRLISRRSKRVAQAQRRGGRARRGQPCGNRDLRILSRFPRVPGFSDRDIW